MSEAKGYWIAQGGRQELLWIIDGGFVSDRALRSFIYHNNEDNYRRYVGPCVLKAHADQWAAHCVRQ